MLQNIMEIIESIKILKEKISHLELNNERINPSRKKNYSEQITL